MPKLLSYLFRRRDSCGAQKSCVLVKVSSLVLADLLKHDSERRISPWQIIRPARLKLLAKP
jgi:hypothetical protein